MSDRRAEVAGNLDRVRDRIASACARSGRSADEVTLTVVTKFFPASDVRLLAELGVRHVGENRHQEAEAKAAECADLDLVWHFIGGLQSNKAAAVAAYAAVVESVDRAKLVTGLSRGAHQHDRVLDVLVQVSLDPEDAGGGRAGAAPDAVPGARRAGRAGGGAAAARGDGGGAARRRIPCRRSRSSPRWRSRYAVVDPAATWVSAGMSNDLEAAVESGATHVRIGSAVLGGRPPRR